MAYSTIIKPSLHFNSKTYVGNGGTQSITGIGFQPDFIWLKNRDHTDWHWWNDSVRGVTKTIHSNVNNAESTQATGITAFDSDGFTVGADGSTNRNSEDFIAWNWKGGTTSGLSGGNITPSVYSYNATAGFGIYKYTGNGSSDQTIPHGLGKKPAMVIYKRLDSGTNWVVQSHYFGNRVQLVLNGADGLATDSRLGASDNWDATNFNVGTYGDINNNGSPHVAYVFTNIKGYQKIGLYKGNGNGSGTFVYTGFRPRFLLVKRSNTSGQDWPMFDNALDSNNPRDNRLHANTNAVEYTTRYGFDFYANGFKARTTDNHFNGASDEYLYWAIAENPLVANVGSDGVPVIAG